LSYWVSVQVELRLPQFVAASTSAAPSVSARALSAITFSVSTCSIRWSLNS
jgi:hypothetical protein